MENSEDFWKKKIFKATKWLKSEKNMKKKYEKYEKKAKRFTKTLSSPSGRYQPSQKW